MPYLLALDQGTTSCRTIVVDRSGKIVASDQLEFTQYFPKAGWVEHDAEEIFDIQMKTLKGALDKAGITASDVQAIGITNQRETTLVWDKETGKPIHHAIVWQDRRTSDFCEELKSIGYEETIRTKTGLPIDAYFSASKLHWLLNYVEGAHEKAEAGNLLFGTMDTWLIWKMTRGQSHVTDHTNASRTMLFDIAASEWDETLLSLFAVPRSMMPAVKSSSEHFGIFKMDGVEIPISGVAGDQQAALFGQGCVEKGDVKNTYGTGCFVLMNQGNEMTSSDFGLVTTRACSLDSKPVYALEGSVFIGGAAVQWLRDGINIIDHAAETQEMAEQAQGEDELVLVPAFVGLGTPYWDMYARGAVFGLTRDTGREHFAKAALQAIAFQTRDVLDAMEKDSGLKVETLKVDGGATANDYLMQFQADLLDTPIAVSEHTETTALGAAYLAGLQVGFWNLEEVKRFSNSGRHFSPKMEESKRERLYSQWKKAVSRTLGWLKD
ncbi:glycerol kinase GlpK [Marinoscillum sp. MHG1-6]|uniref:glycerol kinase GlpK n=1 Tax=Marinoscillum sp. MHG1-6 TaxID=2959627 RepID=UPI0021582014|nr:glycerol kinase GlpK [Marinoscillum sp. MHG1-6]